MIICLDDYAINLPDDGAWEVTIDDKSSYSDSVILFCLVQQVTQRRVGHIPEFKKIPLAIAMSLHLGKSSLLIDKEFNKVYLDLLEEWTNN